jgi:hypothetical protein
MRPASLRQPRQSADGGPEGLLQHVRSALRPDVAVAPPASRQRHIRGRRAGPSGPRCRLILQDGDVAPAAADAITPAAGPVPGDPCRDRSTTD